MLCINDVYIFPIEREREREKDMEKERREERTVITVFLILNLFFLCIIPPRPFGCVAFLAERIA